MEENKKKNVVVETFADDMAEVLGNDRQGLIKKVIQGAEEEKKAKEEISPESKKNKIFLASSMTLLFVGASLVTFFVLSRGPETVPVAEQFTPMIFNDKITYLDISEFKKDEIVNAVANTASTTTVKKRGIEGIYPIRDSKLVGMRTFFTLIKSSFAPAPEEELVSDRFMMGVVNMEAEKDGVKSRPGFFILLKMRTTPDIFETMRAWEEKMFADLYGLFGYGLNSDTNYLLTKDFVDGLVENKNARLLYDKEGRIVLAYVYGDDSSIVITNSELAMNEIVLRLASRETKE